MSRPLSCIVGLTVLAGLCSPTGGNASSEPARVNHISDPAATVTADAPWTLATQTKLHAFEQRTGIRILLQYHPQSPPADEDKNPGDYMRALATKLGVIQGGVLMVHFADDPDWRIWIGDSLTPKFVEKPGDAKTFTENGQMHEAKEAYLSAAMAKADALFQSTGGHRATGKDQVAAGRLLALQTDSLLDGLFAKLSQ